MHSIFEFLFSFLVLIFNCLSVLPPITGKYVCLSRLHDLYLCSPCPLRCYQDASHSSTALCRPQMARWVGRASPVQAILRMSAAILSLQVTAMEMAAQMKM